MAVPTDTLLGNQWHLIQNTPGLLDLNVRGAWEEDITGAGVIMVAIDDAFDYTQSDLAPNYNLALDFDFEGGDSDPFGVDGENHGTAVIGLMGADDNGTGVVGVAFDSQIYGFRINGFISNTWLTHIGQAIDQTRINGAHVANISQGMANAVTTVMGGVLNQALVAQVRTDIGEAVDLGRSGLGVLISKSAGNSRGTGYDVNGDMWTNDTRQVSVAAVDQNGFVSSYSSFGAANLVSGFGTPGQVWTTDRVGAAGYDATDFTSTFNGTSSAAPMVAGVIGLILDANETLGWRDVQNILSASARHVGTDVGLGIGGSEREAWSFNGSDFWNGGGQHFSIDYGYGLVDATAATRMAETWLLTHDAQTSANQQVTFEDGLVPDGTVIPDGNATGTTFNIVEADSIEVERVTVTMTFSTTWIADLELYLTSPDGTVSTLMRDIVQGTASGSNDFNGTWTFESNAFRGELSNGTWQVRVVDDAGGDVLTVSDIVLRTFGAVNSTSDRYVYTDEYSDYFGTFGHFTNITGTPVDVVNASAVTTNSIIRLTDGSTSTIDGIGVGFNGFWDAIGGDGNDVLAGNANSNQLWGMRGNDFIDGGNGIDIMRGGAGNDTYIVDNAFDQADEGTSSSFAPGSGGTDTVRSTVTYSMLNVSQAVGTIEKLLLLGGAHIHGTGNAVDNHMTGNTGNNSLNGGLGNDTMIGGAGNDSYIVNSALDVTSEAGGSGTDIVHSAVTRTMSAGIENMTLLGGGNIHGIGNTSNNKITGNSGNNSLNGGTGADTMTGGAGNDSYVVDNASDVTSEAGGSGVDTVISAVNRALGAGLENLTLIGAATLAIGNDLNNRLTGNAAANTLQAGIGADTMLGGAGNDIYHVDNVSDITLETGGSGIDTVVSSVSRSLGTGSGLENLALTGSAVLGFGNELANSLTGHAGANTFFAKEGNDTMTGGGGADRFNFDTVLNGTTNVDTINGFSSVDDIIGLAIAQFANIGGSLDAGEFVVGAGPVDGGDRIIYNSGSGDLFFDGDGTGGVFATVRFARLAGGPALSHLDFVMF